MIMSREMAVTVALLSLSTICVSGAAYLYLSRNQSININRQNVRLSVAPEQIIGSNPKLLGTADSPYTLVEFADYECPACRDAHPMVINLLKAYHGVIKYEFRNLPLNSIHPDALPAAIAVERCRSSSQYWTAHNFLFEHPLTTTNIGYVSQLGRTSSQVAPSITLQASNVVAADMSVAKQLGVNATPTFILCSPKKEVVMLASIDDVWQLVPRKS